MDADFRNLLHVSLLSRGFALEAEVESPESFGSWYRDYERSGQRIRLLWDGKDRWFVLQGGQRWRDLAIRKPTDLSTSGIDEFLRHADLERVAPPAV